MNQHDILIVGGTGRIGSELVSLLINAGICFRILVRQQSAAQLPQHENCEIVHGDLTESSSLEVALSGIRRVFLLSRDQTRQGELESHFIELAERAGVEKMLKISAFAAGLQPPAGYGIGHAMAEKALMASGLAWTILRPYMFMQNFLDLAELIKSRHLVPLPMGKAGIALIDARDVALVAKTLLSEEGHENTVYNLSGPAALQMSDCADILTGILGYAVRYRSPPVWLTGLIMRMQGVSAWDVNMRKQLFQMIREGGEAGISNHVERITGCQPRSFEKFVREYQQVFQ